MLEEFVRLLQKITCSLPFAYFHRIKKIENPRILNFNALDWRHPALMWRVVWQAVAALPNKNSQQIFIKHDNYKQGRVEILTSH